MLQIIICLSIMMLATNNEFLTRPISLFAWEDDDEEEEDFGDSDQGGWEE